MSEHPIIFSTEMVRAILDGRKTQTRRIIRTQPEDLKPLGENGDMIPYRRGKDVSDMPGVSLWEPIKCLYGKVGDTLWVRETWQKIGDHPVCYAAGTSGCGACNAHIWRPNIHMFRKYARIFLEITNIRVERVQDIDVKDITSEGLIASSNIDLIAVWIDLWDSLNAKRGICKTCNGHQIIPKWVGTPEGGDLMQSSEDCPDCDGETGYGWDKNPWVWVIEFNLKMPKEYPQELPK